MPEMENIQDDPRFAHIATDPRFRPMPKSKRKVKIDSRFESLFTNRHFSHRTDMDKRGRPVRDSAKKNQHVMQKFYQMSESDSSDDDSDDSDKHSEGDKRKTVEKKSKIISPKSAKLSKQTVNGKDKKEKSDISVVMNKATGNKKRKADTAVSDLDTESRQVKKRKPDAQSKDDIVKVKKKKLKGKLSQPKKSVSDDEEQTDDESDDPRADDKPGCDDETGDEKGEEDEESEEEDSDDDDEEDLPEFTEDYELEETEVDHKWNEMQNEAEDVTDSTRRLAVCNMDWDFIKAQDLYVLFKSFVPQGGNISSVAIYPSEFGKQRMAEEAMLGPKEIREGKQSADSQNSKKKKGHKGKGVKSEKEQEAAQREKLREYQLNRLRYYYAVVDCDSVATADSVYKECDKREFELSSVRLDLRYIPEDMRFDDEPREVFREHQSVVDYQPSNFSSTALCQANVEVTWDETEFDRLSKRVGMLQRKELESIVEENKYADIIAPPESDSEDEDGRPEWLKSVLDENSDDEEGSKKEITEEEKIKMYRSILMEKMEEEEKAEDEEKQDVDKVVEWQPGLKASAETKLKKKSKKKEETTVVNEYLEKKKEKKKKKKAQKLKERVAEEGGGVDEEAFSDDEMPEGLNMDEFREMMKEEQSEVPGSSDTNKKKKKKKKGVIDTGEEVDEQERAELELMLMGDGSKMVSKPELVPEGKKSKKAKKKLAMQKKKAAEQEREDFVLDVEDDRFKALYTSHHFHIDPSAPQFKKTKNMVRLVEEQIKRKKKNKSGEKTAKKRDTVDDQSMDNEKSSKSVSQSLIESLKKKMKK